MSRQTCQTTLSQPATHFSSGESRCDFNDEIESGFDRVSLCRFLGGFGVARLNYSISTKTVTSLSHSMRSHRLTQMEHRLAIGTPSIPCAHRQIPPFFP